MLESEPDATAGGASSCESGTAVTRLEEGLRRKSLPPLVQEARAIAARGSKHLGKSSSGSASNSSGGRRFSRRNSGESSNSRDNSDNTSGTRINDNGGDGGGGDRKFKQQTGPLSCPPATEEMRLSPPVSSARDAIDSVGVGEGGNDGGRDGGGDKGGGSGEVGGSHNGAIESSRAGVVEVDVRDDPKMSPRTESGIIKQMDEMRRSIDHHNKATSHYGSASGLQNPKARKEEAAAATEHEGGACEEAVDDDEDSPQRLFIGWMQARQREFVTVISLGCVTALFATHIAEDFNGTLPMMVTFIPLAVHVLLVRDIYIKWEDRQKRKHFDREQPPANAQEKTIDTANDGGGGEKDAAASDPMPAIAAAGAVVEGVDGVDTVGMAAYEVGARVGTTPVVSPDSEDVKTKPNRSGSTDDQTHAGGSGGSSNDSPCSSNRSGMGGTVTSDYGRRGAPSSCVSESDDGWLELGSTTGSENMLKFLETPFQKSVRLLNIACENVSDPIVRKVLKTVAQLLSDPDSLHKVKEGSIRRMTMDLGTRNYLENVLQTPVKSTTAEDNWKKLRTGMFVVRAMAREAAAAEDFLSAYETRQRAKSAESSVDNDNRNSELDDLLEDIENGVDTTTQDLVNTTIARKSSAAAYAQDGEANRFSNFNRNLILGQQLVAKTLSRGDLRKDPDRLSVRELRDLVSEHKTPDKIMELTTVEERATDEVSEHKSPDKTLELTTPGERAAGAGQESKEEQGVSPVQDDVCEVMLIPRLPILDESVVGNVASLLADGQFLKWDFNVFTLE
ncbi:unnamed protein product, partial [Ectocarpus sp. 13 AM-2016]